MGIYATVLALGFAAGPAILALAGTSGWPPYLAGAALYALAGLPLLLGRGATPALEAGHGARSALAFLIGAPLATLAALLFGGIETGAFTHLPLYGLDLGHGAEQAALLVSLMAIGNVLFQIPIGLLADRFDKRFVLLGIAACGLWGPDLCPSLRQPTCPLPRCLCSGEESSARYTRSACRCLVPATGARILPARMRPS